MKLPAALINEYRQHAEGDPLVVARALYDLDGCLGETYTTTDGSALLLCTRRVGGEFHIRRFEFGDLQQLTITDEGSFVGLRFRNAEREFKLRFSLWDRPALEQIRDLWSHLVQPSFTRDLDAPAQSPAEALTPLTAFCAALHAMMQADGQIDPNELWILTCKVPRPDIISAAARWWDRHGKEALERQLHDVLNPAQKRCLLANLVGVAAADGLLRRSEQSILGSFQQALGLPADEAAQISDVLLLKNNLAVFADPGLMEDAEWPPVVVLAAAAHAVINCDQEVAPEEADALQHLLREPELVFQGATRYQAAGAGGVIAAAARVLNHTQRRCLVANLIALALADGLWRSREQALLQQFRSALGLTESDYQPLLEVLLLKYNLSIFTS